MQQTTSMLMQSQQLTKPKLLDTGGLDTQQYKKVLELMLDLENKLEG